MLKENKKLWEEKNKMENKKIQIDMGEIEEKISKNKGQKFWTALTDKGPFSVWDEKIAKELSQLGGHLLEVEMTEKGQFRNIVGIIGQLERPKESQAPKASPEAQKQAYSGWNGYDRDKMQQNKDIRAEATVCMLVSYAKDLVVAGKAAELDKAIQAVMTAYDIAKKKMTETTKEKPKEALPSAPKAEEIV